MYQTEKQKQTRLGDPYCLIKNNKGEYMFKVKKMPLSDELVPSLVCCNSGSDKEEINRFNMIISDLNGFGETDIEEFYYFAPKDNPKTERFYALCKEYEKLN